MDIARRSEIVTVVLGHLEITSLHPYHNVHHTKQVIVRFITFAQEVVPSLTEEDMDVGIMAALFHDYGHCGQTIRQTCPNYVPRRDLSNEEYAAECAALWLKDDFNEEQLKKLQGLILATSFGQNNPAFQFHRTYEPETHCERVLALADIGGFYDGFKPWMEESLRVLQEADTSAIPADFASWQKNRCGFLSYIEGKLKEMESNFKSRGYLELLCRLQDILASMEKRAEEFKEQFETVRARRLADLQS